MRRDEDDEDDDAIRNWLVILSINLCECVVALLSTKKQKKKRLAQNEDEIKNSTEALVVKFGVYCCAAPVHDLSTINWFIILIQM